MTVDLAPLLAASKRVDKAWGTEFWLTNTEKYCAKILEINPGWMCSIHSHDTKDETFLVIRGIVVLEVTTALCYDASTTPVVLYPGSSYRLVPKSRHRFSSGSGATILEISTEHKDEDVERFEESRRITPDIQIL